MTWVVLALAVLLICYIIRTEILANRVYSLEHEVHDNLRPRSHKYADRIMRLEIKTGLNGDEK